MYYEERSLQVQCVNLLLPYFASQSNEFDNVTKGRKAYSKNIWYNSNRKQNNSFLTMDIVFVTLFQFGFSFFQEPQHLQANLASPGIYLVYLMVT